MTTQRYIRGKEAARYCREKYGYGAERTFAKLRCVGGGPKFVYSGRIPLYTYEWIDEWALIRLSAPVSSTSEIRRPRSKIGAPQTSTSDTKAA